MLQRLRAHPPWRQLLLVAVAVPAVATLAVLVFAWPSARIAPRDVPVGIVGTGTATQHAVDALARTRPGAFDLHLYADRAGARTAIEHRDIYGAFALDQHGVTVLDATAAAPAVAQVLTETGQHLAAANSTPLTTVDVVPLAAGDPRGSVFASALLPLIISGLLAAAAIALLVRLRPVWRQLAALVVVSAIAGAGAYVVAQGFLDVLPGGGFATWASLTLTVLAISAAGAGLVALLGTGGLGVAAVLMVFIGNPFSGVTSAPELLPSAVGHVGQWLPPGAAAELVRSTAYFHGHGAGGHLTVLLGWTILGFAAILVGHRRAAARKVGVVVEIGTDADAPRHLVGAAGLHEAV